ncbi:double-stranded RNA adenosine deaminase activity, partial [Pristimantis euphronides]
MQKIQLLEYNSSDKIWSIKTTAAGGRLNFSLIFSYVSDTVGKVECRRRSGRGAAAQMVPLTELQESIVTFLKSNKPSRAINVAKGVGKKTAKDVNPDLYMMKSFHLPSYNEQQKLWTINTGPAQTLSETPTSSSEDSTTNQSYIEADGCKDIGRDSGIGKRAPRGRVWAELMMQHSINHYFLVCTEAESPNNTVREEPDTRGLPTGDHYLPPYVKNIIYNINIHGCRSFIVGDAAQMNQHCTGHIRKDCDPFGDFPYGRSDASDSARSQMPVYRAGPLWDVSGGIVHYHSTTGPLGEPLTSSPAPFSHCRQTLNISEICDGLGNVTLDNNSE